MKRNRWVAGTLCVLLLTLLIYCIVAGVADLRTHIMLAFGVILGFAYSLRGRLPDELVRRSGGSITHDDDATNVSPKVYLPILLVIIAIACTAIAWVLL
ncbi:MAG: hypothetical protein AAF958_10575 [Planctomycetota bacterium]